jgi:tripartite-type tricarboxylate transporter receptor subunit TctC
MPVLNRLFAIAFSSSLLLSAPGFAASSDMFKGKTITYIVATSPGGGYDTYGRLIVRHLQKYLPGSRILVKNVAGAGNIIGANQLYTARPDGLTIGMFNTGLIYDQLVRSRALVFDLSKFSWIGKASTEARALMIAKKSGLKNFDDLMKAKTPAKFATSGIGTAAYFDTHIIADALGLKVQLVNGFSGNEGEMSMLRGELAAQVSTVDSLEQFVKNGNGFWALAITGNDATLPGVPKIAQYLRDDRAKQLLALLQAISELGRLTAGPPGIPADILAVERQALTAVMKDSDFLAEAKKLNLPIDPLPGEAVEAKIKAVLNQPAETIAALKRAAEG